MTHSTYVKVNFVDMKMTSMFCVRILYEVKTTLSTFLYISFCNVTIQQLAYNVKVYDTRCYFNVRSKANESA